jgi:hypothetical protein
MAWKGSRARSQSAGRAPWQSAGRSAWDANLMDAVVSKITNGGHTHFGVSHGTGGIGRRGELFHGKGRPPQQ